MNLFFRQKFNKILLIFILNIAINNLFLNLNKQVIGIENLDQKQIVAINSWIPKHKTFFNKHCKMSSRNLMFLNFYKLETNYNNEIEQVVNIMFSPTLLFETLKLDNYLNIKDLSFEIENCSGEKLQINSYNKTFGKTGAKIVSVGGDCAQIAIYLKKANKFKFEDSQIYQIRVFENDEFNIKNLLTIYGDIKAIEANNNFLYSPVYSNKVFSTFKHPLEFNEQFYKNYYKNDFFDD